MVAVWEEVGLGRAVNRGEGLAKGRAVFLKGSPGLEEPAVGEDRAGWAAGEGAGGGAASATPSSCGSALPAAFRNALWQRLPFLSCAGNACSSNSQTHSIRSPRRRGKGVLSAPSYRVGGGLGRCWRRPARSARVNNAPAPAERT